MCGNIRDITPLLTSLEVSSGDHRRVGAVVKVKMVFNYFAYFFQYVLIMWPFILILHISKAIAIYTLMKGNAFVSGMALKTPLIVIFRGLIIPTVGECIRYVLGLGLLFRGYFSRDIVNDCWGNIVVCVSCPKSSRHIF